MNSMTFSARPRSTDNSSWQDGYEVGVATEASQRTSLAIRWATIGFIAAMGMAFIIAILAHASA